MGLIRKTLFIGTAGIVRPNSKKQRMSKKQLKEMQKQTQLMQQQLEQQQMQQELDEQARLRSELNIGE